MGDDDKLVRDYIPHIIRAAGQVPVTRTARHSEMHFLLHAKLREEVEELHLAVGATQEVDELVDILEVVRCLALWHGVSLDKLEEYRLKKEIERGGFNWRVVWRGNL